LFVVGNLQDAWMQVEGWHIDNLGLVFTVIYLELIAMVLAWVDCNLRKLGELIVDQSANKTCFTTALTADYVYLDDHEASLYIL
jgi:hypothetical protein